jgi:hypothetical protein
MDGACRPWSTCGDERGLEEIASSFVGNSPRSISHTICA